MVLLLGDKEVNSVLDMHECVNVMEDAFTQIGQGETWNRPRSRIRMPKGFHHLMAASVLGSNSFGLKTYTSFRAGIRFLTILYDSNTGDLQALIQGGRCSQIRTGAVSAIATRYMARTDSTRVGIIGAGYQARAQLEGVCAVRSINEIKVYDRSLETSQKFSSEMSSWLGQGISVVPTAQDAVNDVDIVITMTTSREPVLFGEWLKPGMHVNAAGSNHWIRREVDDDVIRRSDIVVVDSIADAQVESGDLLYPIERGLIRWDQIHELSSIVVGRVSGRDSDEQITLFESQGIAVSDVAVASHIYAKAKEAGLGLDLPLEN
ncbi:ornithine cyclodeaminase family protein [SAR202 cluster bacterium AC-409-J13_OGT_754m]|nr:ornithine cyclodeaminase family protein [SAR202 cluster bacterium AC-409-J13_OGT_754m]